MVRDAPCLFSSPFFQFATSTAISTGLSGPFGASAPGRRGYRSLDLVEMQGRRRGGEGCREDYKYMSRDTSKPAGEVESVERCS